MVLEEPFGRLTVVNLLSRRDPLYSARVRSPSETRRIEAEGINKWLQTLENLA